MTFRLWTRLSPTDKLSSLSRLDKLRFSVLIHFCLFGVGMMLCVLMANVIGHKYDRILDNLGVLVLGMLPTLWLTYQLRLKVASWYFMAEWYLNASLSFYRQLMSSQAIDVELSYVSICFFALVLLEGKASLIVAIVAALHYFAAKVLLIYVLHLPIELGHFTNGFIMFCVIIYFSQQIKGTLSEIVKLIDGQNTQLVQQNEELKQLDSLKNKLFAILGHDLRSPIATLKILLQNVARNNTFSNAVNEDYKRLRQMVDAVYITIDNLLNWATLQCDGALVRPKNIDLSEIVEMVLQLYETELQVKQLTVKAQLTPTPAKADEHQLEIVVRNLLQNAIKFTPAGGLIQVSTRPANGQAMIVIQDSGIGMSINEQAERNRVVSTRLGTAGEKGTGLGLVVCRELVRLNQGEILFDSVPGQGTTVTVLI